MHILHINQASWNSLVTKAEDANEKYHNFHSFQFTHSTPPPPPPSKSEIQNWEWKQQSIPERAAAPTLTIYHTTPHHTTAARSDPTALIPISIEFTFQPFASLFFPLSTFTSSLSHSPFQRQPQQQVITSKLKGQQLIIILYKKDTPPLLLLFLSQPLLHPALCNHPCNICKCILFRSLNSDFQPPATTLKLPRRFELRSLNAVPNRLATSFWGVKEEAL